MRWMYSLISTSLLLIISTVSWGGDECRGRAYVELTNMTGAAIYCGSELAEKGGLYKIDTERGSRSDLRNGDTVRILFKTDDSEKATGSQSCSTGKGDSDTFLKMKITIKGCEQGFYQYKITSSGTHKVSYSGGGDPNYQAVEANELKQTDDDWVDTMKTLTITVH